VEVDLITSFYSSLCPSREERRRRGETRGKGKGRTKVRAKEK
jgi:hypothetical protein